MLAVIDPSESILWQGRLPFPKAFTVSMILLLFVLLDTQVLAFLGYFHGAATVDAIVLVLVLLGVIFLRLHRGVHFYITSRRVVKTRDFYRWSRTWDLPLASIVDVATKRDWSMRYIIFIPALGRSRLAFGPLEDDPEKLREIALRARSSITLGQ